MTTNSLLQNETNRFDMLVLQESTPMSKNTTPMCLSAALIGLSHLAVLQVQNGPTKRRNATLSGKDPWRWGTQVEMVLHHRGNTVLLHPRLKVLPPVCKVYWRLSASPPWTWASVCANRSCGSSVFVITTISEAETARAASYSRSPIVTASLRFGPIRLLLVAPLQLDKLHLLLQRPHRDFRVDPLPASGDYCSALSLTTVSVHRQYYTLLDSKPPSKLKHTSQRSCNAHSRGLFCLRNAWCILDVFEFCHWMTKLVKIVT